jgi:arylsulfatase A-like enzyme
MMWELDESVGRVVRALEVKGMLENSIIVFVSDNGAPSVDVVGYQNWGSNYPLRGVNVHIISSGRCNSNWPEYVSHFMPY